MSALHKTAASLRFFGNDLDPEEITCLLGGTPTVGVRKGGVWLTESGAEKIARRGSWRLKSEDRSPGDLDGQITELFSALTTDLAVWKELSRRFDGDVFLGLFLQMSNEGISLTSGTLTAVGSRGLTLDMGYLRRRGRRLKACFGWKADVRLSAPHQPPGALDQQDDSPS